MSLEDLLTQKSQEIETEKQQELDRQENERQEAMRVEQLLKEETETADLLPVRQKIEQLEGIKQQLEMIRNSLSFKSEEDEGMGMHEYSNDVIAKNLSERTELDAIMANDKYAEAFEDLKIKNTDELIENPGFAGQKEIVSYKKSVSDREGLLTSDTALYQRLIDLRVISADDAKIKSHNGFVSYEEAEKALNQKLEKLEEEITLEKIKTPEGNELRGEVVELISNELTSKLKSLTFSIPNEVTGEQDLVFGNNNGRITIKNSSAKFAGWMGDEIIPSVMIAYKVKYGEEISNEAFLLAYSKAIDSAFEKRDKVTYNKNKELSADLERSSPEKWAEAHESFENFNKIKENFRNALGQKEVEMREKGLMFNSKFPVHYGGSFEDFLLLSQYDIDNKSITEVMQNGNVYPQKLYFDELKKYIDKRIEQTNEFIEAINSLETQDDLHEFSYGYKCIVGDIHKKIICTRFDDSRRIDRYEYRKLSEYHSYEEARRHFEKENEERKILKERLLETISGANELVAKKSELESALKIEGYTVDVSKIDALISSVEKDKIESMNVLDMLEALSSDIPDERLLFEKGTIFVPSVQGQINELKLELNNKNEDLAVILNKFSEKKPLLTRKTAWQKKQKLLQEEINELNNVIDEEQTLLKELPKKKSFDLQIPRDSTIVRKLDEVGTISGNKENVLKIINDTATELVTKEVSEDILRLNFEYKELQKKVV